MMHYNSLKILIGFIFVLILPQIGSTQNFCKNQKSQSETMRLSENLFVGSDAKKLALTLEKKSFVCTPKEGSCNRGFRCRGTIKDYPEALNIFIPPTFIQKKEVPFMLHFHGHNQNPNNPEVHFNLKSGDGDYGKMLAESQVNGLLIIPESKGKCSTYFDFLKSSKNLDQLLSGIENVTETKVEKISFSSHSGGDRSMDTIARWYSKNDKSNSNYSSYLAKTQNIGLFDSLYADRDALSQWPAQLKNQNPKSRFYGSYVVGPQASTTAHMKWLKTKISGNPDWEFHEVNTSHMAIMKDGGFAEFLRLSGN